MTSAVVRMYETEKQARKAVAKLTKEGAFAENLIHLVTPSPEGAAESSETLSSLLKVGKLLRGDTKVYAEALKEGRSLVIVEPPFGQAQAAIAILDSLNPIPLVVEPKAPSVAASTSRAAPTATWDAAAPLSSALGLKVLSAAPNPTPFFRLLKRPTSGLSALLGLKLLAEGPAPLSSYLGLKTLSDDPHLDGDDGEGSTRLLLSSNPTPFSSKLDFKVLSTNPTPLSSAFGFRVLSDSR